MTKIIPLAKLQGYFYRFIMKGEKTGAIILAGGSSERMGFPKPFLMLKDKTFLETVVQNYHNAGISDLFVVVNEKLNSSPWERFLDPVREKCTVINNPNPNAGRGYSLKLGLDKLNGHQYCFIQNVDGPDIGPDVLNKLYDSRMKDSYVQPVYEEKNGHPVLLSRSIFLQLKDGKEEIPLNVFLKSFNAIRVPIETNAVLMNINTTEEYLKYLQSRI